VTITLGRRTIAIAGAVVLIVIAAVTWFLVGGSGPDETPDNPAAPAVSRTQAEIGYLDQVKTAQAPITDDDALRLGRDNCKGMDALRSGGSVDFLTGPGSLEQLAQDGKLSTAQVHGIESASAQYLCPANLAYYQSQVH
jgi:hypothetical protein